MQAFAYGGAIFILIATKIGMGGQAQDVQAITICSGTSRDSSKKKKAMRVALVGNVMLGRQVNEVLRNEPPADYAVDTLEIEANTLSSFRWVARLDTLEQGRQSR